MPMIKPCLALLALTLYPAFALAGDTTDLGRALRAQAPPMSDKKVLKSPANPCSEFGAGFVRAEGSTTCVRLGGAVRIEAGSGVR
jgi:hypothetical protein